MSRTQTDIDDVRYRIPFAKELAYLLLIHLERKRDLVTVFDWPGHDRRNVESTARSPVQDAHQGALRIAIANLESLHVLAPSLLRRFLFQQHL